MESTELDQLSSKIKIAEKKASKRFSLYTILMILLGVSITIWSGWQANQGRQLKIENEKIRAQIDSLEQRMTKASERMTFMQEKLLNSYTVSGYVRSGLENFYQGKYSVAIAEYNEALKLDPDNFVLYDFRGYAEYKMKEYDLASKSFSESLKINPRYAWGYYNLILVQWAMNDKEGAYKSIKILSEISPDMLKNIKRDPQFSAIRLDANIKEIIN